MKTKISKDFQKKRWWQCGERERHTVVFVWFERGGGEDRKSMKTVVSFGRDEMGEK